MSHRVDHVIHAHTYGEPRKLLRIGRVVRPLPSIARVRIEGDGHHDAALVVENASPVAPEPVVFVAPPQKCVTHELETLIQIVDGMKDWITVLDFHDGTIREHALDARLESRPLLSSVEIVRHEKATLKQVVTKFIHLNAGQV